MAKNPILDQFFTDLGSTPPMSNDRPPPVGDDHWWSLDKEGEGKKNSSQ